MGDDTAPPTIQPVASPFTNQLFAPQKGKLSDNNDWNNHQENGEDVAEFDKEHNDLSRVENIEVDFDESVYISVWLICGLILLCSLAMAWKYYDINSKPIHSES